MVSSSKPGYGVQKFLQFPQLVEPAFFLGKPWEVAPPDVARVLGAGAGVDHEKPIENEYPGGLSEEGRHVEVMDRIEGDDTIETFILKRKAVSGRSEGVVLTECQSLELTVERPQHLQGEVQTGEADPIAGLFQKLDIVTATAATRRRRRGGAGALAEHR